MKRTAATAKSASETTFLTELTGPFVRPVLTPTSLLAPTLSPGTRRPIELGDGTPSTARRKGLPIAYPFSTGNRRKHEAAVALTAASCFTPGAVRPDKADHHRAVAVAAPRVGSRSAGDVVVEQGCVVGVAIHRRDVEGGEADHVDLFAVPGLGRVVGRDRQDHHAVVWGGGPGRAPLDALDLRLRRSGLVSRVKRC